jgi:hypothetical protein
MLGQAAFHSCTGLTSVSIPSSLTYISDSAFYNCTGLTSVTLPSSVMTLQPYAFGACTGLTRINFMGNAPSVAANSFTGVTAVGYYQSGTTGWTNPFCGLTMATTGAPTVTSQTSASIASTTATLGGNVTVDGGSTITARGVVYALTSTNANPRLAGTGVTTVAGTGTTGAFTVSATGLTPGAAYSYAAYATNSSGTSYATVGAFTTLGEVPTITTQPSSTSVTAGTAARFTVLVSGTSPFTYVWKKDGTAIIGATSATYTIASVATSDAGNYTVVVTNSAGSATSSAATLTVIAAVTAPIMGLTSSISTSGTAATISVTISSDGGATITARGVVYALTSANPNPQLGGVGVINLTSTGTTGTFVVDASSLTTGGGYSYAAYATNSVETSYSAVGKFSTLIPATSAPVVTAPTYTSIASTTATLGGNVTSDGGAPIIARGVVYALTSANSNPQLAGTGVTTVVGTGSTGVLAVSATGLTPGAAYSYAAYATNSAGTSYTAVGTFTTLALFPKPTLISPAIASITSTTAILGGNVTSDGGAPITARGVVYALYSANSNPQLAGPGVVNVAGTGTTGVFAVNVMGLTPGTIYSYAAYATNSSGTSYAVSLFSTFGGELTITTQPSSTSAMVGSAASFSVSVSGNAQLSYVWKKDGAPITGATSATYTISAVAAGDAGNYTVVVTDGPYSATSNAATLTVTAAPTAPTVSAPTKTNITTTTATLGGNVTSDGGATITARGVVYALTSANANPQLNGTGVTAVAGSGTTGVFTVSVTGLTPNVSYTYIAYATNDRGTAYSTAGTFKMLDSAGDDFTYADTGAGIIISRYRGAGRNVVIPSSLGGVAVTSIADYAFYYNSNIRSVTIPDSVTSIGSEAFGSCKNLVNVTLSNALISIGYSAFYGCSELKSITIPDSVTSIEFFAFGSCIKLEGVTLSNKLKYIGDAAFAGCERLLSVVIPASVMRMGQLAFSDCVSLTRVNFLGDAPKLEVNCFKNVTATGYYQSGTKGWTTPFGGLTMMALAGDFAFTDNGTAATITGYVGAGGAVTIPSAIGGHPVTSIGNGAFYLNTSLTIVTIPTSVTRIGSTAFQGCSSLTNVTLPNNVTDIGEGVFLGCVKLSSVTIPSGLTTLRTSVFAGCTALTTVTIPSTITTIEDGAFYSCTGLKSISFLGNVPTATALSFKGVTAPGIRQSEATGWTNTFYGLNIYIGLNGLTIKSGPVGATINQGQNATFSVVAEGTGPFTYQWKKDGAVLTGATAATLRLVNVTVAQAGNYTVAVSNIQGTTISNAAVLTVNTPLTLTSNPVSRTAAIGDTLAPAFSVTATAASGVTLTYQWRKDGVNILGATSATLGLTAIKATDFGTYSVTITSPTGTLTSTGAVLSRAADPVVAPVITRDPSSVTINLGSSLILSVAATGSPAPTYQWQFNGVSIPGANAATLVLTDVIAAQAGTYNVVATNTGGTATSKSATVATSSGFGRQLNISTRGYVGTGGDILIPGFVIAGNGAKRLLIRAAGPALSQFGVSGVLADPQLAVFKDSTQLFSNDNWSADAANVATVTSAGTAVGAFALAAGSKDAALVTSLEPGAYTIQVSGVGNTTGTAIVEVYDLDVADANKSRLVNLATRALVQAGAGPLISGFVVQGAVAKAVIIRATGPALAAFGVTGTLALPKLTLFDDQGKPIIENTGWESSGISDQIIAASQSVGAFGLTRGTADSVILAVLPPGAYTAQVIGADGGSGVTLVEVYELP